MRGSPQEAICFSISCGSNLNRAPQATRFKTTSYDFLIRINQPNDPDSDKAPAPKEMSLVWHDYPGEWLETTPETPEEKQRQKDTIASLMGSDVALLLIDASRLTTDPDTQARYLKSVLGNYRETIQRMRQDLLPNGRQAAGQFPAHLGSHPFEGGPAARHHCLRLRDLVVLHAGDEINQLRADIGQLVKGGAVSIGEDYLRLSSAQFNPDQIKTEKTIGLDTIVPLTMLLPIGHFSRWEERKILPIRKAQQALYQFNQMADNYNFGPKALAGVALANPLLRKIPGLKHIRSLSELAALIATAAQYGSDQLERMEDDAKKNRDYLRAALLNLEAPLTKAEEQAVLVRKHP